MLSTMSSMLGYSNPITSMKQLFEESSKLPRKKKNLSEQQNERVQDIFKRLKTLLSTGRAQFIKEMSQNEDSCNLFSHYSNHFKKRDSAEYKKIAGLIDGIRKDAGAESSDSEESDNESKPSSSSSSSSSSTSYSLSSSSSSMFDSSSSSSSSSQSDSTSSKTKPQEPKEFKYERKVMSKDSQEDLNTRKITFRWIRNGDSIIPIGKVLSALKEQFEQSQIDLQDISSKPTVKADVGIIIRPHSERITWSELDDQWPDNTSTKAVLINQLWDDSTRAAEPWHKLDTEGLPFTVGHFIGTQKGFSSNSRWQQNQMETFAKKIIGNIKKP